MLESLILFRLKQYPGILAGVEGHGGDIFSNMGERTLEVHFSDALSMEVKRGDGNEDMERIFAVPCLINSREFFVSIIVFKDGSVKVEASRVGDGAYDKSYSIKKTLGDRLKTLTDADGPVYAAINITDKSVRLVVSFLERAGVDKIKDAFISVVKEGRVFVTEGAVFIFGGISSDKSLGGRERAWSMLEQLLLDSNVGTFDFVRNSFFDAFNDHCADEESFDVKRFKEENGVLLSVLESGVANEGGITFFSGAYKRAVDLGDVKMSDCQDAGVVDDIVKTISILVFNEAMAYNADKDNKIKILPNNFPHEIRATHLSEYIHPAVVVRSLSGESAKKGEILVNENFVKAMYMLRMLKGKAGDILSLPEYEYDDEWDDETPFDPVEDVSEVRLIRERERIGNLYESILYSIMLSTIRGGFRFENGAVVMNTDQEWAQGERGRKYRYVNVLSLLFFWLVMIESRKFASESNIKMFLEQHKEITRGLSEDEIEMLPEHLLKLAHDLSDRGIDVAYSGFPRVLMSDPMPGVVFGFLNRNMAPVSADEIARAFRSSNRAMIADSLDILEKAGAVTASGIKNAGGRYAGKAYVPVLTDRRQKDDIQSLLTKYDNASVKPEIASLRTEVLRIVDTRWAGDFLRIAAGSSVARRAIDMGNKMIIAIETDWVPDIQRDFIRELVREIARIDGITVIRGNFSEIAEKLKSVFDGVRAPWDNVVVLAGEDTLDNVGFDGIRRYFDVDNKALFVGVDAKNVKDNSYVRLMEMLATAVRMGRGQREYLDHPGIDVRKVGKRTYIFTPEAEPLDFTLIKMIYDAQKTSFSAAKDTAVRSAHLTS